MESNYLSVFAFSTSHRNIIKPNEINQLDKISKPVEVIIDQDNSDISYLSGLGASLASITPYQKRTPRKKQEKGNTRLFDSEKGTNLINSQLQKHFSRAFYNSPIKRKSTKNGSIILA